MGQLDGKIAIVTGAGVGIGEGIARRYVEEGARVCIAELNPEHGKATADRLGDAVEGDLEAPRRAPRAGPGPAGQPRRHETGDAGSQKKPARTERRTGP